VPDREFFYFTHDRANLASGIVFRADDRCDREDRFARHSCG
jgi:hypothetical protein